MQSFKVADGHKTVEGRCATSSYKRYKWQEYIYEYCSACVDMLDRLDRCLIVDLDVLCFAAFRVGI